MSELLTVHTAQPSDIWPNGSGYSREVEAAIIKIARAEISAEDVARSGLVFSHWYIPFYLAEGRWRQRQMQQAEQRQQAEVVESSNARRVARLEKKLTTTRGYVDTLIECFFSKPKDEPDGELPLFRMIRNIAWDQIHERKIMRDAGIWDAERLYGAGAVVTDRGSLWVCQTESKAVRPGDGACWRLASGSDVAELRSQIKSLEAKIAELETRKIPQYRGVWQEGQQYEESDLCTFGGSMWFCRRATTGRPSTHHEDWQLCVKSGRDGRPR